MHISSHSKRKLSKRRPLKASIRRKILNFQRYQVGEIAIRRIYLRLQPNDMTRKSQKKSLLLNVRGMK